ncbi:MAG: YihY/virulence factor BrkB family protein [Bacteroidales bacterium]
MGKQSIGIQSVAITFFTLMSFVPMVALIFTVSDNFGLGDYLKGLIYQNFTNQDLIDTLLSYSNNIMNSLNNGTWGIISFLLFIWLVIWMMINVERAFNLIWEVDVSRVFWKRILAYIGIIILSPFVIIIFLAMLPIISRNISELGGNIPYAYTFNRFIFWLLMDGVVSLVLTALFILIPNAKVKFKPAFKAALMTGIAFTVIQYLYIETQVMVTRLNGVYGTFAAIPLFMIWIRIAWLVILIGVEISYAFQHVDDIPNVSLINNKRLLKN